MRTFAFDLSVPICFAFLTNHEMSIGHMIADGNGTSALVIEQSFGEQTSLKESCWELNLEDFLFQRHCS